MFQPKTKPVIKTAMVTVLVRNLDLAVLFYTNLLGFIIRDRSHSSAVLESPGLTLRLAYTRDLIHRGDGYRIDIQVANLDEALHKLESNLISVRKVRFLEDDVFLFTDMDGNLLSMARQAEKVNGVQRTHRSEM